MKDRIGKLEGEGSRVKGDERGGFIFQGVIFLSISFNSNKTSLIESQIRRKSFFLSKQLTTAVKFIPSAYFLQAFVQSSYREKRKKRTEDEKERRIQSERENLRFSYPVLGGNLFTQIFRYAAVRMVFQGKLKRKI